MDQVSLPSILEVKEADAVEYSTLRELLYRIGPLSISRHSDEVALLVVYLLNRFSFRNINGSFGEWTVHLTRVGVKPDGGIRPLDDRDKRTAMFWLCAIPYLSQKVSCLISSSFPISFNL